VRRHSCVRYAERHIVFVGYTPPQNVSPVESRSKACSVDALAMPVDGTACDPLRALTQRLAGLQETIVHERELQHQQAPAPAAQRLRPRRRGGCPEAALRPTSPASVARRKLRIDIDDV